MNNAKQWFTGEVITAEELNRIEGRITDADGKMYRPNLLINSDFRNPINQRGATFYDNSSGNNVYTIDRWRINGLEVTVNEGSITIENKASTARNFLQPFEFSLRNDVYTASCNVLAVSGQVRMFYGSYGNDLHVGVNTFTFPQAGMNMFIIVVDAGASVTLEWVKLEQGSIATPFVPRPYAEELALCQRYARKYYALVSVAYPYGSSEYGAFIPTDGLRIGDPTISQLSGMAYLNNGEIAYPSQTHVANRFGNIAYIRAKYSRDIASTQFYVGYFADAEIY